MVNTKILLKFNPPYVESTAANEFYFLHTKRKAEERTANANYRKGIDARKTLIGQSAKVNTNNSIEQILIF